MKRLYVAISHHGLGHLAQTSAVLNALSVLAPDIEWVIRTALPAETLRARLRRPFEHLSSPSDCNLVMHDAIRVDVSASLRAYQAFHDNWDKTVAAEARQLEQLGIDAVFSNIGYLPLAAAQRLGVPAVALCSLNWADIFSHYLGHTDGAGPMLDQMNAAYASARAFLRPEPSMPMDTLNNRIAIPPVVIAGQSRRDVLLERLDLDVAHRLVLIGMGGIHYRPPVEDWPEVAGLHYLVPDIWQARHPAVRALSETGLPFNDVLASVDAVVSKPGYGTYTEAAARGRPLLYIPRPDWPEAPYLNSWLESRTRAMEIPESRLLTGHLLEPLERLWSWPAKPPTQADGAAVAARYLLDC